MVEGASRHHKAVEMSNRDTYRCSGRRLEHAARCRPVPIDVLSFPPIDRRRNPRSAVKEITNVAYATGIKHLTQGFKIIMSRVM
jgi:hypothetical protein